MQTVRVGLLPIAGAAISIAMSVYAWHQWLTRSREYRLAPSKQQHTIHRADEAWTPAPAPLDDDPVPKDIFDQVQKEAEEVLFNAGVPVQIGYTEILQAQTKQILKEKYGLEWNPPRRP